MGNIRFVISPQGTSLLSTVSYIVGYGGTFTDQWLTTYKYDVRQRVVEKKVSGCLPEYYVYDNYDRIVLSQNGNQRTGNKWSYVKYDALNRIVQTGLYSHTSSLLQADMQSLFTTSNTTFNESRKGSTTYGYSNVVWPTSLCEALILNYFDDYDFNFDGIPDYNYSVQGLNEEAAVNTGLKGLPTGEKVKILGSSSDWLIAVSFYDKNYRPIQIQKNNHKNLTTLSDVTTNINDFIGKITYTKHTHNAGSNLITITNRFDYDHIGRPLKVWQKVNTDPEILLSQVNYNELGQAVEKNLHSENSGSTFLQSLDFTYNIRGWLTELNNSTLGSTAPNNNNDGNDLFNMSLRYETPVGPGMTPRFNGRIGAQCWKGANAATSTNPVYVTYDYNGLQNFFGSKMIVDPLTGESNNNFKEDNITYDLNGNISTLDRTTAAGVYIDKLAYIYNGNKLIKITDASGSTQGFWDGANTATEYTYDNNGNLLSDDNRALNFNYGYYNNLPTSILKGGPQARIEYTYSADGTKLQMKTFSNWQLVSTLDYIDNFIYKDNAIYKIGTSEGRMSPNGATYTYEYDLKDHLGNVRMSFDKNPSTGLARIIQEDHYYPYGMQLSSNQYSYRLGTVNNMLFNGKEKMDDLSLGMYDYGARFYDPAIGRWISADPLASFEPGWSPYRAFFDNPITIGDPTGMLENKNETDLESTHTDENGNVIEVKNDGDNGVYKHAGIGDVAKKDIDNNYSSKNTAAGGTKMGETEFWDEFARHNSSGDVLDNKGNFADVNAHINYGKSIDAAVNAAVEYASTMMTKGTKIDVLWLKAHSANNHDLDIKTRLGAHEGYLLNGFYVSGESAGNYVFGVNLANSGNYGFTKSEYWNLSARQFGAYHNKQNHVSNPTIPPYYGEIPYSGRQIAKGYWGKNYYEGFYSDFKDAVYK